jgi:tetratricopeptide (TPR) repeat protein
MARLRTRLKRKAARAESRTSGVTNPTSTTYCHQAIELSGQGRHAEAETHLREALRLWPNDIDLLNELGLTIWRQGRPAEAEEIYRRAYRIKPDDFRILANLGVALHEQDRFDEASEFCRRAIQFNPDAFDAHMNLGVNLSDQGKFDEATVWLERAHQLRPDSADIYLNLGMNLLRQGRIDDSINQYEQGLRLQPEFPRLHRNLAHALLCQGDYERGWQEHEWRMKCDDYPGRRINRPLWNGENFPDRTILLHHEQGFGDTLQLIRFAPLVRARGRDVLVGCPQKLLRLVARCQGVDLAFDGSSFQPNSHIHAPLFSLPALLGTTLSTLPARVPYLVNDPVLVEHWRSELARVIGMETVTRADGGQPKRPFLIGIAWQGNPSHQTDRWRSFPLSQLAPLAELPGVRLINLQTDDGLDQIAPFAGRLLINELTGRRLFDFAETAAIVANLDLVIAPDTAVSHLAGGLGVPVWIALCSVPDWRWLHGRDDSPWYPTMRLFRQTRLGDWDGVFRRMTEALKSKCSMLNISFHN